MMLILSDWLVCPACRLGAKLITKFQSSHQTTMINTIVLLLSSRAYELRAYEDSERFSPISRNASIWYFCISFDEWRSTGRALSHVVAFVFTAGLRTLGQVLWPEVCDMHVAVLTSVA